jgi:hypothetical protein
MSGKRRKYTPEFREQAARLVIETGRPVAHVAVEIGVGEQVLGRWVRLESPWFGWSLQHFLGDSRILPGALGFCRLISIGCTKRRASSPPVRRSPVS